MDQNQDTLLSRAPVRVPRRALTVAEYRRMGEVGILSTDDRVELIEGELVAMSPIGSRHAGTVMLVAQALIRAVNGRAVPWVQNPVQLGDGSEPQPDVALLRPRADAYLTALPRAGDVLLAVEVADTSLPYDRSVKAPLHARHGVPETWIVDVMAGEPEVCRKPTRDGYAAVGRVVRDATLAVPALADAVIAVRDILPDHA